MIILIFIKILNPRSGKRILENLFYWTKNVSQKIFSVTLLDPKFLINGQFPGVPMAPQEIKRTGHSTFNLLPLIPKDYSEKKLMNRNYR